MGHRASPSVSDIVIFYLEEKFFKFSKGQVLKWLRFRDDVIALFNGTRAEAISFLDKANEIHNTLKFKYQISEKEGIFLDTVIFKGPRFKRENVLDFKPYVKPTEAFQYIHRTSSHLDWPQSLMSIFFSKTDNLSKIAIYKLYLEVEVLGLDIKFDYQRG